MLIFEKCFSPFVNPSVTMKMTFFINFVSSNFFQNGLTDKTTNRFKVTC